MPSFLFPALEMATTTTRPPGCHACASRSPGTALVHALVRPQPQQQGKGGRQVVKLSDTLELTFAASCIEGQAERTAWEEARHSSSSSACDDFYLNGSSLGVLTGDETFFQPYEVEIRNKACGVINAGIRAHGAVGLRSTPIITDPMQSEGVLLYKSGSAEMPSWQREAARMQIEKAKIRNMHISRGVENEFAAMIAFEDATGHRHVPLPPKCIFHNSACLPEVVGSPDFILYCGAVVEIKCPQKLPSLIPQGYLSQLQCYMHMLGAAQGYLVQYCATSQKKLNIVPVDADNDWLRERSARIPQVMQDIRECITHWTMPLFDLTGDDDDDDK